MAPFLATADSGQLTITSPGQVTFRRHIELLTSRDSAYFQVLQADLDADGVADLVVAVLSGVSNGLGIASYDVTILDGKHRHPPQTVALHEYNAFGSWVRLPGYRGCLLLFTSWRDYAVPNPPNAHPGGTYFSGRLWPRVDGALDSTLLPKARTRRLFNSFAVQRSADSYHQRRPWPLSWLTDARAVTVLARTHPPEADTVGAVP